MLRISSNLTIAGICGCDVGFKKPTIKMTFDISSQPGFCLCLIVSALLLSPLSTTVLSICYDTEFGLD